MADRFLDLVDRRLAPVLESYGFERRHAVLARDTGEVRWLVEVELAPWTNAERICFTLAWGVAVPGLDEALGDRQRDDRVETCPIRGRLGESSAVVEAMWFSVGPVAPVPLLAQIVDRRTALMLLREVDITLLPALDQFRSIPDVQAQLVAGLARGRGAAGDSELGSIRTIAGLSLLLGERENASRWLDYLEARSSVAIAPDVVAQRLSPLRDRCAS